MSRITKIFKSIRENFNSQIINCRRVFKLLWKASPYYTILWSVLLILQGVLPGLLVYLTKLVVDNLVIAINGQGEWEKTYPAIFFITVAAGVTLLVTVTKSILDFVRSAQADIVQDYVKNLIHEKSAAIDLEHFESHEYHDRLEQATSDGANRPLSLLENIGGFVQNTITLLVMAGLLISYSIWLPIILLVSTLPVFIIVLRYDRRYHEWWKETTKKRRWIQYFDIMLTHRLAVAEMKVFDLNPHFQGKYQSLRKDLREEKLAQIKRLGVAKAFAGIISLAILGAAVGWMGWRTLAGILTLGDLALFYQAFNQGQGLMRTMLGSLGSIIKDTLFLSVLFEFLDLNSNIKDPESPVEMPENLAEGIAFKNVAFSYPGSNRTVFENLNLFIPAGKSVAIVGENGSGKTTMLKLICRFYDPDSGSVEFDGVDLRQFSLKKLLRFISITFQTPLNYHATIEESIAMGDLEKNNSRSAIEKAAKDAGAHEFIMRFPEGYDTLLGKVHAQGAELSGGEWQRLALARSYFREAPIVLLDEPTSFMDSWAEGDWFRRFKILTKNRTSIVITHRFTIAMRADLIIVMDKGRIVESGNHRTLLEMDGLYAQSWEDQMKAAGEFKFQKNEDAAIFSLNGN